MCYFQAWGYCNYVPPLILKFLNNYIIVTAILSEVHVYSNSMQIKCQGNLIVIY